MTARFAPFFLGCMLAWGFLTASLAPLSAQVTFEISNAGVTVEGSFEEYTMDIQYNPAVPSESYFQGSISIASLDTGISLRDKHLRDEDYFHAEAHPEMTFSSQSVTATSNGTLKVRGMLEIKGTSKEIEFEVTPTETSEGWSFVTSLIINRLDFGVGESSWILADDVKCMIQGSSK